MVATLVDLGMSAVMWCTCETKATTFKAERQFSGARVPIHSIGTSEIKRSHSDQPEQTQNDPKHDIRQKAFIQAGFIVATDKIIYNLQDEGEAHIYLGFRV